VLGIAAEPRRHEGHEAEGSFPAPPDGRRPSTGTRTSVAKRPDQPASWPSCLRGSDLRRRNPVATSGHATRRRSAAAATDPRDVARRRSPAADAAIDDRVFKPRRSASTATAARDETRPVAGATVAREVPLLVVAVPRWLGVAVSRSLGIGSRGAVGMQWSFAPDMPSRERGVARGSRREGCRPRMTAVARGSQDRASRSW
jgi:hypothetical protein